MGAPGRLGGRSSLENHWQRDVFGDVEVIEQAWPLEDQPHAAGPAPLVGAQRGPADRAATRGIQAGDQVQQGRFSRSRGAGERDSRGGANAARSVAHGGHRRGAGSVDPVHIRALCDVGPYRGVGALADGHGTT